MPWELERNLWRLQIGITDDYAEQRRKPIDEHVADYIADVRAKSRCQEYVTEIDRMLATR